MKGQSRAAKGSAGQSEGVVRMNEAMGSHERRRAWASGLVTVILSIAAFFAIAFGVWIGLGDADTEPVESPLMLSVARQLDQGPWGLYGPFGRQNPLVLIHAPLFYHLAALLAWPIKNAGASSVTAARLAGRALSLFSLLLTCWSAFRIARLDRAPARVGWWAACLVASASVLGTMPFAVRPDMLGVAFQTTGVLLVLSSLQSKRPGRLAIVGGFAAFGLAMCVKQNLVGGFSVATILSLWAVGRGRMPLRKVAVGVLTAAAVAAAVYITEELATEGRMSQAVFVAATATPRVHPSDSVRAAIVVSTIIGGSLPMIALLAFAGLAQIASKPGIGPAAAIVGSMLVGFALIMPIVYRFVGTSTSLLISDLAAFVCLLVVIPVCVILERRAILRDNLDAELCLFGLAELAIIVPLCMASSGVWVNYAIPGIVIAAILTARSVSRACNEARLARSLIPMGVAAVALLGFELNNAFRTFHHIRAERLSAELVLYNLKERKSALYFAGAPGKNRVCGSTDLVFDDWLFPVFESLHLAEPRSSWLSSALTDGSVRFVITTSNDPMIDGLDVPLTALGYVPRLQIASFYVWERLQYRK
jgi:hypothetical protein